MDPKEATMETKPAAAEQPKPAGGKAEPSANGQAKGGKSGGIKAEPVTEAVAVPVPAIAVKQGPHEPSGETCKLTHLPAGDDPGGPCQRCKHCGKKLRPHEMGQRCEARG